MPSLNKVILIGRVGKDPESKYMPNGDAVVNLSIATSETWKDKASGEKKEATEWHRVVFFRKLAEIINQYVQKGSLLYIEGSLKTRKWTDKDGVERYTTEITGSEMKMLGSKQSGGSSESKPEQKKQDSEGGGDFEVDIPFTYINRKLSMVI